MWPALGTRTTTSRTHHSEPKATLLARQRQARQQIRQATQRGFCAATDNGRPFDCAVDSHGAFGLDDADAVNWQRAARACVARCLSCSRCRFISISLAQRDCSWAATCDALHSWTGGFRTAQVRFEPLSPPAKWQPPLPLPVAASLPEGGWHGWTPGYCDLTNGAGDCSAGDKGTWSLRSLGLRAPYSWAAAAAACLRRCRSCARCRYVSISRAWDDCSWFFACKALVHHPQGFQSALANTSAPLPMQLPQAPASWRHAIDVQRRMRERELQAVFNTAEQLHASPWAMYLHAVYDRATLAFPFSLTHLEFFYTPDRAGVRRSAMAPGRWLPRQFYDPNNMTHVAQVQLGPGTACVTGPEACAYRDNPRLGDVFELDTGPPNSLFVYLYPTASGQTHSSSGRGRVAVPFKYAQGFPSHSKVEVMHHGRAAEPGGYWMYLARGSGIYLDLGQTMVFAEQWDALKLLTGCGHNCSAFLPTRQGSLAFMQWAIYRAARARGISTLQYTHRSESVYRFEVVDVRVTQDWGSCGFEHAFSSGWQGVRPCSCDRTNRVLNCLGNQRTPEKVVHRAEAQGRRLASAASPMPPARHTHGMLMLIQGKRAAAECFLAAAMLRAQGALAPGDAPLHLTAFVDAVARARLTAVHAVPDVFDALESPQQVVDAMAQHGSWAAKLVAFLYSPYQRTLFTDCDTAVARKSVPADLLALTAHSELVLTETLLQAGGGSGAGDPFAHGHAGMCSCIVAWANTSRTRELWAAAQLFLTNASRQHPYWPHSRHGDQEALWVVLRHAPPPGLGLRVLPLELQCPTLLPSAGAALNVLGTQRRCRFTHSAGGALRHQPSRWLPAYEPFFKKGLTPPLYEHVMSSAQTLTGAGRLQLADAGENAMAQRRSMRPWHAGSNAGITADGHEGYCAVVERGPFDCATGSEGSFALTKHTALWGNTAPSTPRADAARDECTAFCSQCARCAFVSYSLKWGECSWFSSCPAQSALRTDVTGFTTLLVPGAKRAEAAPRYWWSTLWIPPSAGGSRGRLTRIFLSHTPKTGTPFVAVVLAYACGRFLGDNLGRVGTTRAPRVHGCAHNDSRSSLQLGDESWYHGPVPAAVRYGARVPGGDRPVMLFRRPAQRLLSSLTHMHYCYSPQPRRCQCCWYGEGGSSWGWGRATHTAAARAVQGTEADLPDGVRKCARTLAARGALWGCQAKQLLGFGCHARLPGGRSLSADEVAAAVALVRDDDGLAFVGLTERYVESVCLWHALFGGPLWQFELRSSLGRAPQQYDERLLEHFAADDTDQAVYEAAVLRFERDLSANRHAVDACLAGAKQELAREQ